MISNEQIAHDLTMVYLNNRFGIDVEGVFTISSSSNDNIVSDVSGTGSVTTNHMPSIYEPEYIKVGTGQRNLFGFEKKEKIQNGYVVDDAFRNMIKEYRETYERFFQILNV